MNYRFEVGQTGLYRNRSRSIKMYVWIEFCEKGENLIHKAYDHIRFNVSSFDKDYYDEQSAKYIWDYFTIHEITPVILPF